MIGSTVHQIHFSLVAKPQPSEQIRGFEFWITHLYPGLQVVRCAPNFGNSLKVSKSKLKLGNVKDSNAAVHSVDSDIFCAVIHLPVHPKTCTNLFLNHGMLPEKTNV